MGRGDERGVPLPTLDQWMQGLTRPTDGGDRVCMDEERKSAHTPTEIVEISP